MVEVDLLWLIGLFGAGALAGYFAFKYRLAKVVVFFDEVSSFLHLYKDILEDDVVNEEEARSLWAGLKLVYTSFKDLIAP